MELQRVCLQLGIPSRPAAPKRFTHFCKLLLFSGWLRASSGHHNHSHFSGHIAFLSTTFSRWRSQPSVLLWDLHFLSFILTLAAYLSLMSPCSGSNSHFLARVGSRDPQTRMEKKLLHIQSEPSLSSWLCHASSPSSSSHP